MNAKAEEVRPTLKLDLGCGKNKRDGFLGIDRRQFEGVDGVTDLTKRRWIFSRKEFDGLVVSPKAINLDAWELPESSVDEVHCSHFLEHLTGLQRVGFFNELYRVLIPGGKATIITPHWNSNRAYGDFTHQWPPVSEMLYYYVSSEWRKANAPDNDAEWNPEGYVCDFAATWGYGMHPEMATKNSDMQQYMMAWYKEACQDLHATLVAKK